MKFVVAIVLLVVGMTMADACSYGKCKSNKDCCPMLTCHNAIFTNLCLPSTKSKLNTKLIDQIIEHVGKDVKAIRDLPLVQKLVSEIEKLNERRDSIN